MTNYVQGGRGLEEQICTLVRDLEGKVSDDGKVWGPLGPPLRSLEWIDVCSWLSSMGVPEHALDAQRAAQYSGQWYEDAVYESSSSDQAIETVEAALQVQRKLAMRLVMNIKRRNVEPASPRQPRSPLQAAQEIIKIVDQMNTVGFGRYHGAEIFASKFCKNKGIDALLGLILNSEDETCIECLKALLLVSSTSEEKPTETSHEDALQRFEKRKLIIKAQGIPTLLNALLRSNAKVHIAVLQVLKSITAFPDHWTNANGENMIIYYKNASQELIDGGIKIILRTISTSESYTVKLECLQILQDLLIHDMQQFDRNCSSTVDGSFYIPSAMRNKFREDSFSKAILRDDLQNTTSSTKHTRKHIIEEQGIDTISKMILAPAVRGTLKVSNLFAKQLPRVDRMGDSDPFCRIFIESHEARTETIFDNCNPEWSEEFIFQLEDVCSATLVILIFDEDDNDVFTLIAMASLPLAEIVHLAEDSDQQESLLGSFRFGKETTTEVLNAFRKNAQPKPIRIGNSVLFDSWVELKERNSKKPSLIGGLGFLHLTLDLETTYQHDLDFLQVRASALGVLHFICADTECKKLCVAQKNLVQPTVNLMKSWNGDAQMNAARFLRDLAFDETNISLMLVLDGIEGLVQSIDFGSIETKTQAAQTLAFLAFNQDVRDKVLLLKGHIGASAKDTVAVIEDLLKEETTMEDTATASTAFLINLCLDDFRFRERIVKSTIVSELIRGIARYRGNYRSEACCLLALLAESEENRLPMSRIVARSGEESLSVVSACTLALCSTNSATDARTLTAAEDARVAASNALCFMSEYGGLEEVIKTIRYGNEIVRAEAASTLGKIASLQSDRMAIIKTDVIPNLVELIISSSFSGARINAATALAKISEPLYLEPASEVRIRLQSVCKVIPALGLSAIDPVINVLLRSSDEEQRCVAAWALSIWCLVEAFANKIWEDGSENLLDILYGGPEANPDGVYFCVSLLGRVCQFEPLRATVGECRFTFDGRERSTLEAVRHVLRISTEPTVVEDAARVLQSLCNYGGLEELTDIIVSEDGDVTCLKMCAAALQPLCAREDNRRKVAALAGLDVLDVSMWVSKYVLVEDR